VPHGGDFFADKNFLAMDLEEHNMLPIDPGLMTVLLL
jgi:hypothetical protein